MLKEEILDILKDCITEVSPYAADLIRNENFSFRDACLIDLGVNSIDYVQIAHMTMDHLNVNLSIEHFANINRVSDIVEILLPIESFGSSSVSNEFLYSH